MLALQRTTGLVAFIIYKNLILLHADTLTVHAISYPTPSVRQGLYSENIKVIFTLEVVRAPTLTGKTRDDLILNSPSTSSIDGSSQSVEITFKIL